MENKCLVTKLQASVNDDSLEFFDGITFDVTLESHVSAENITLIIGGLNGYSGTPFDIKILGDGYFISPENSINLGKMIKSNQCKARTRFNSPKECYDGTIGVSLGKYKVLIKDKYNIISIGASGYGGISFDLDKIKYCDYLINLMINTDNFKTNSCVGDLSNLLDKVYLQDVRLAYTNVSGNIISLGKSVMLNNLFVNNTNVEGTLESLCNTLVSAGKTSGTINLRASNSLVTYQGKPIEGNKTITFSGSSYSVE